MLSEPLLLLLRAVVLERQNHREVGRDESRVGNGLDDVAEEDVSAERHAVRDDGLLVFLAVPAVELDAAAAREEHAAVHFDARLAAELAPD